MLLFVHIVPFVFDYLALKLRYCLLFSCFCGPKQNNNTRTGSFLTIPVCIYSYVCMCVCICIEIITCKCKFINFVVSLCVGKWLKCIVLCYDDDDDDIVMCLQTIFVVGCIVLSNKCREYIKVVAYNIFKTFY